MSENPTFSSLAHTQGDINITISEYRDIVVTVYQIRHLIKDFMKSSSDEMQASPIFRNPVILRPSNVLHSSVHKSLWQSSLTRASRCANSQASASNAGVPGDPNSTESNCSYLALILSVKELYSLCASCTVNK